MIKNAAIDNNTEAYIGDVSEVGAIVGATPLVGASVTTSSVSIGLVGALADGGLADGAVVGGAILPLAPVGASVSTAPLPLLLQT